MPPSPDVHAAPPPVLQGAASAYLDALRAFAANLVVLSHIALVFGAGQAMDVGASIAVSLFFLLSGFLITQSLLNRARRPGPRLPGFLADRVARIATPYVPALVLIAAANALLISTKWGAPGSNTGVLPFVGNLLMLQDHSLLRLLEIVHIRLPWHIAPYNTAEPFWTVSIELWIYVGAGLFCFCLLCREAIRRRYLWPLVGLSFPVLVWNAAAGGGKSLTLIWLLGAVAACALDRLRARGHRGSGSLAFWLMGFGAAGLAGRVARHGLDGYDLQTAALIAMLVFGGLIAMARVRALPRQLQRLCGGSAAYSYSLYLIHNTVLVVVHECTPGLPRGLAIALALLAAHLAALLLYQAFERHHRHVARWLRPRFERALLRRAPEPPAPVASPVIASP